jgi:hypothetical protein
MIDDKNARLYRAMQKMMVECSDHITVVLEATVNPTGDLGRYSQVLRDLSHEIDNVAHAQWQIIQASRAWSKMFDFGMDYAACYAALWKLHFAGAARKVVRMVGIVNPTAQLATINDFCGRYRASA